MVIFVLNEASAGEKRCAATPETVKRLLALAPAPEVVVESGLGAASGYPDADYQSAGATVVQTRGEGLGRANVVLRVNAPAVDEIASYPSGALSISLLDPFNNRAALEAFSSAGVNAISLEMIPRTTLAQKMDVLSSQANLAGYSSVVVASGLLGKILPMMMTPAGTISPAKVFVIGVGVAGLQAIATAKRLGARVDAFDTRPVVEEQVKSLGAKFLKIDLGDTGQTDQGYAKELTPEQIELQQKGMAKACAGADIVITTAKLFGRPAPKIVTQEMVAGMRPGAVIVDLAADTGGNVEGTIPGEVAETDDGVRIIGTRCMEGTVARDASGMLASNLFALIEHFFDKESGNFDYREEDEILKGCLIVRDGAIVHEKFKNA
ncbi:NAD(P) transhydrogenase subunit alpha [Puniceicoccus vermicola]|uniref:proton-translocating NAD(P)(+) transhydrogenase n=1 Tax=Puniceicoccus vermicola TaxID=388746 RepID=A0A7X1AXJ9_9BACT|nr:NAD(P) transhydrogenase subunit alpha [Puniceicoccus vermicola]MBC2601599.1 NAD(P) transhydrogenase subunit alpha [Puniceicoccus vermicola]